jgi:hypothetical protein
MDLPAKAAAFCRELGDSTILLDMARAEHREPLYRRAEESLKAGTLDRQLEADLDALDQIVRAATAQGLYSSGTRRYTPLPGYEPSTGAQWWTCPRGLCAGRGRVKPAQATPTCGATGEDLIAEPLAE